MKKLLGLICFVSFCTSAFSQKDLIADYVVTTSGDTIGGLISDRLDCNAKYIEHKNAINGEVQRIPLSKVDNFYLKKYDNYFFRRTLDIDKKPVETSRLEGTPGRRIETDTVVIRLLVKGAVNLFDYVDENAKKHFFVQKGDDNKIEELAYVRYTVQNGARLVEMPYFVEPLKAMLSDCDKVGPISKNYDEKPLVKAVTQYNSCFATTGYAVKKQKGGLSVGLFAGGGPSYPTYRGVDQVNDALGLKSGEGGFSSTTAITAGVNLDFISGRESSRFVPGLQFGYVRTGEVHAERVYLLSRRDLWMDFSMVTAVIGLKYKFVDRSRWNIYTKATFGTQVTLTATSKYTNTDFTFNTKTEPKDFTEYKKGGYSYSLGVGAAFGRLFIEGKFQQNVAVAVVSAQGITSSVMATLGFRLTRR